MSVVSLEKVKHLRSSLDAPYKDCVAALQSNDDDLDKAIAWLKEKGKGEQRDAVAECGAIGYYKGEDSVSLIIVKCETDFVAINKDFITLIDQLAKDLNLGLEDKAVDKFRESAWTFKENIQVGAHLHAKNNDEKVVVYLHHNRSRASILRYIGEDEEAARKVAMQICAMKPSCVSRADVPEEARLGILDKARQEARDSGKPEAIVDKIADGKLNNALKGFVLLEQPMFDDAKTTVEQFVQKSGITVVRFTNVMV